MKIILLSLMFFSSINSFAATVDIDFEDSTSVELLLNGAVTQGCKDFVVYSFRTLNSFGLYLDEVTFDYKGKAFFAVPKSKNTFNANYVKNHPTEIITISLNLRKTIVEKVSVTEIKNGNVNNYTLCK